MSELTVSSEFDASLRERRSILASYVMANIYRASSVWFEQDLEQAISYTGTHTHFADGRIITSEDVRSLAASSVLVQMVGSYKNGQLLVFSPDIPTALPVYQEAQTVVDAVGLTLVKADLDPKTVLATAQRLNGKDVPTTPNIEAAVAVQAERGTVNVEMESIDDIQVAMDATDYSSEAPDIYYEEDGVQVEGYNLSNLRVPSITHKLPFYAQFFEVEQGTKWLKSLLEDIKSVKSRMI